MSEPLRISRKLGTHAGDGVVLVHAPEEFALGDLPEGATLTVAASPPRSAEVIVAFYVARARLEREIDRLSRAIGMRGALWVAWPRRAAGGVSDLTDNSVRGAGLGAGLVDVKVTALGEAWSSLRFVVPLARRTEQAGSARMTADPARREGDSRR